MVSIPMMDVLVSGAVPEDRPDVLPRYIHLPTDFNSVRVDLDDTLAAASYSDMAVETTLDSSQRESLCMALTKKVSLIQGPPGTGKTFLGSLIARILLQNSKAKILCVCYTNHALDQFLEHILDKEPATKIARMGGSAKISDRMAPYALHTLARSTPHGGADSKRAKWALYTSLSKLEKKINDIQSNLSHSLSWDVASDYLRNCEEDIFSQLEFYATDSDGFQVAGSDGKRLQDDYFWNMWCGGKVFTSSSPAAPFPTRGGPRSSLLPHESIEERKHTHRGEESSTDGSPFDGLAEAVQQMDLNSSPLTPQGQIWEMSLEERNRMISIWHSDIFADERQNLCNAFEEYLKCKSQLTTLYDESKREVLSAAQLIGVTTSGAAKFHDLIEHASADVVIVEEAGEILEAHVLTSLSSSTKQLILIGDHLQLRPKLENYNLSVVANKGFNLDVSLFERLVINKTAPVCSLHVQHRMRPEVSQIIRMMTYPELEDHPSVSSRPSIHGISRNIAFIDHAELERGLDKSHKSILHDRSKINDFEVQFSCELVRHLLLQNYKQKDVVVLTPYLGQLKELRKYMQTHLREVNTLISDLDRLDLIQEGLGDDEDIEAEATVHSSRSKKVEGVRVSTVDNYQGEECDIVIISLVRSNENGDIGFMREPQRVNVMLSRARNGMYLIGNSSTFLASKRGYSTWSPVIEYFMSLDSFLNGIPSFCQKHPNEVVMLTNPADFRQHRPNGGCNEKCTFRMSCGHSCPQRCHVIDEEHVAIKCFEKCERLYDDCPWNHVCPKQCHQPCGDCCMPVDLALPCGHNARVPCYQTISQERVDAISCSALVEYVVPGCGHKVQVHCFEVSNGKTLKCTHTCDFILPDCLHKCPGSTCGECKEGGLHLKCNRVCGRDHNCAHQCERNCHPGPCSPCNKKCAMKCKHSTCPLLCCKPCAPCINRCEWFCEHLGGCPLPCSAPCSRLPCDKRCKNSLECGHQCPGLCGEQCPTKAFCHVCGDKKDQLIDLIMMQSYADVDVDQDPVVFLGCGHFYPVSVVDGMMELDRAYRKAEAHGGNEETTWGVSGAGLAGISYDRPRTCPDCRTVITSVFRYGRPMKYVELSVLDRRHLVSVDEQLRAAAELPADRRMNVLSRILKGVKKGPKRVVYEAAFRACSGSQLVDCPIPNPDRLIRTYKALTQSCIEVFQSSSDTTETTDVEIKRHRCMNDGLRYAEEGLAIAGETLSRFSAADLKILKASLLLLARNDTTREEILRLCGEVIDDPHDAVTTEQRDKARVISKAATRLELDRQERLDIRMAMASDSGVGYGGNGISGHWYECSNGHEYFIGECGGATQESKCSECGEVIGGSSHQLVGTSRPSRRMDELA